MEEGDDGRSFPSRGEFGEDVADLLVVIGGEVEGS